MSGGPHILMVEDDERLAELVVKYLSQHGFHITWVQTGEEGAQLILETSPDLVILDLMLPGQSGLDVCRQVRKQYHAPILMLTASQSAADHLAGLELGADDFVTKPLEPRILLARIRTLLRRINGRGQPAEGAEDRAVYELGPLSIDVSKREARVEGSVVPLTSMELDVLLMLIKDAGSVVTREELYEKVLQTSYDGIDRGMDVHVSRIRRKLQDHGFDPTRLKAVRGAGYFLAKQ